MYSGWRTGTGTCLSFSGVNVAGLCLHPREDEELFWVRMGLVTKLTLYELISAWKTGAAFSLPD